MPSTSMRQSLGLLADASKSLASSLDLTQTLPAVTRLCSERVADACVIALNDSLPRDLDAISHRQPEMEAALRSRAHAAGAGVPWWNEIPGVNATVFPLSAHDRDLGSLVLLHWAGARSSSAVYRTTMEELAVRIAVAVENAMLYQRERRLARVLQTAMLPSSMPNVPGYSYHASYLPATVEADVGGDWYDVFALADGRIALSVGDVAGHGLGAAVIMGEVRQTFRVAAMHATDPAAVLQIANDLLLRREQPIMVTALFGVFDGQTLHYACAGHPPPLLATDNKTIDMLPTGGLPLGVDPTEQPTAWTVSIPPGSLLVLYTDGLIEFTRDVAHGENALLAAVRDEYERRSANPALGIQRHVIGEARNPDDIAILTLSVADAAVKELNLTYSAVSLASRLVRQAINKLAIGLGLTADKAFALKVAVGEAVNNVIEHAYLREISTLKVKARVVDGELAISIEDEGKWRPARQDGGGRGLSIIRGLMKNVEVNLTNTGTTVSFACELDG